MTPQRVERRATGQVSSIAMRGARQAARLMGPVMKPLETVVWGGEFRERFLIWLLGHHYQSLYRRQWVYASVPPHYFDHRIGSFAFATGATHPYTYYRGFVAAEMIRDGSVLLDIGCGDGFFDRRFFAPLCDHVDAVDVDPDAIGFASRRNSAGNVRYTLLDAVRDPFPRDQYDVIVMDGSLGHLSPDESRQLLTKVRTALSAHGVFVGSESLGIEGSDHLQYFDSLSQLGTVLGGHFEQVYLRARRYRIPAGIVRNEAYWRCAMEPSRIADDGWERHPGRRDKDTP